MALRDFVLAVLSTPIADTEVTRILNDRDPKDRVLAFEEWLINVKRLNPTCTFETRTVDETKGGFLLEMSQPYLEKISFRFVEEGELLNKSAFLMQQIVSDANALGASLSIIGVCADETVAGVQECLAEIWRIARNIDPCPIIMEPAWLAAIVVEQMRPLLTGLKDRNASIPTTSYFEQSGAPSSKLVNVRRVKNRYQSMLGTVVDEPGSYSQRVRSRTLEQIYEGEILLCTTFLPPVTHSLSAVERFYKLFGASDDTSRLIRDKAKVERNAWREHVSKYKRVDIIDRGLVEEYFAAPEYYQMPLDQKELLEQLGNILELLKSDNYTMCLTPEAVGISYELKGNEVQIRTDRRNKGQPRLGRISTLIFNDPRMREIFEREFWSIYRVTEAEFKNKEYVMDWFDKLAHEYKGKADLGRAGMEKFDVFLCHNSADKATVKIIGEQLKDRGIRPWLDEWNLIPGRPWQRALEAQIENIKSAAVFVGESGLGPWTHMELDAFIREFVSRGCPVIPVILPTATTTPDLPVFLKAMHWVDFRKDDPDPLEQLRWGITGEHD